MGFRTTGAGLLGARIVRHNGDPVATGRAANEALQQHGAYAYLWQDADGPVVCCVRAGRDRSDAEFLLPGRQLVVGVDGGWRIEPAPAVA